MKTLIVSDMHFKFAPQTRDDFLNNDLILKFMKSVIGQYDLLILNGDIFDLWFDWKYTIIQQHFPLLKILAEIREAQCEIVYISGNHDFWFNSFFPDILDVKLVQDIFSYWDHDKSVLVSHGDLFTTNDLRYKVFRSIIRRRFAKHLYSILHPDLALGIGKTLSRSSRMRRLTRTDRELKLKGLEDYAHKQIQMHGHDVVVLGHSHEPVISKIARGSEESENYGYYVNCGDWIKHYTYVIIIDGIPDLKIFEQKEL